MSFEVGPANPKPLSFSSALTPQFDAVEALPDGAAERLRALRQKSADLHSLLPPLEDRQAANAARHAAAERLKKLTDHRSVAGFELDDGAPQVIAAREHLAKLTDDAKRLNERYEARSAAWRTASQTLSSCEVWLRSGKPPGTALEDHTGPAPTLTKGESVTDGIERHRRRVRELKADLHRVRSAPYPSAHAKAQMRTIVDELAARGAPSVSALVEHGRDVIEWPTQRVQSEVYNAQPGSIAFAVVPDAVALVAFLHRDALIAALDREIASEADDKAALSVEARQKAEAVVLGDLLAVERDEAALTFRAWAEGLPVEPRVDINPVAMLGVRLVAAPRADVPGTSPGHAFDLVRAGR